MGLNLFNTEQSLVSTEVGKNIINVYAWMVQSFMPAHNFHQQVLYPVSEARFFTAQPPSEVEMQSNWIQDQFTDLKDWCKMGKWPLSFIQEPEYIVTHRAGRNQQNLLVEVHSNGSDEKYYVDDYGCPVFYYEKYKLKEPGYINYRIIKKLSDHLHKTATKSELVSKTSNQILYTVSGAFLGLGHLFCAQDNGLGLNIPQNKNKNEAVFALAIYFEMRGISKMRACRKYGSLMSKQTKRDLKIAFKQLKKFKNELHRLRGIYQISSETEAA